MDDFISRKELLNRTIYNPLHSPYITERDVLDCPSAQPDLSGYSDKLWKNAYERGKADAEIQKMQDLEQAEIQKAYELGKLDAMEEMPHWIPCSEQMPEEKINQNTQDFEFVLCSTTFGDVRPYKFGKPIGWEEAHFWHGCGVIDKYVVAWMPFPEPYRAASGETDGEA